MAQIKKPEIRDKILKAAGNLFAERGYARATINLIAKAAGIAPSNVYVYFNSKLEIMFAIYEPWFRQHLDDLEREIASLKTSEAKMFRIVQKLWRDIPSDRNAFSINLIQAISAATPEDKYDPTLLQWAVVKIAELLSSSLPAKNIARVNCVPFAQVLMMAFDGFAVSSGISRAIFCDDELVRYMCTGMLGALRTPLPLPPKSGRHSRRR
ncbi:MAG TPA: TetR/AcrR family transcriptional regulator [Steroidobacteraceae bacterium]|jgi:AcrR family transcriptional regulator|nr:TetR/AcrR family transcriptional regulator [Steroidobacteraceae bacterium]